MPEVTFTPILPGDPYSATVLTAKFVTQIGASVNDLPQYALRDKCFSAAHLNGGASTGGLISQGAHPYTTDWEGAGNVGQVPIHTYVTPYASYTSDADWDAIVLPARGGVAVPLSVLHAAGLDLGTANLNGLLVLFNINLAATAPLNIGGGYTSAAFGIQWLDNAGSWHTIPRSVRICSPKHGGFGASPFLGTAPAGASEGVGSSEIDIPIRTFIIAADVGADLIYGIRAVVAMYDPDGVGAGAEAVDLRQGNLTVIPMICEIVP